MVKVSVIIPVYNTANYLEKCFNSVLNQSYANLEVIIVDDYSSDSSNQIITKFADRDTRIKTYRNEKNLGVAASRNVGLQQVTGEFVFFLDSDDFLDRRTIEILVRYGSQYDVISGKSVNAYNEMENIVADVDAIPYKNNGEKLFRNRSILNKLINTKVIKKNRLSFNETERYFTDLTMITDIISLVDEIAYCKEAIYYKYKRNDLIDAPALMQEDMIYKVKSLMSIMINEKKKSHLPKKAHVYLDNQFLNYYRKSIIRYFRDLDVISEVFPSLLQVVLKIEKAVVKNKSYILKRELRAIASGDLGKYKKVMWQHTQLRLLKRGLKSKHKFYTYLYNNFFIRSKIDERLIVFESFLGKNYSDSPKYIYQHMLGQAYDYKYVWVVNKKSKIIPGKAKQVKRFSLSHYYYLAKAKYWISNARMPLRFSKRPDNIYLQTWHGTPLKKLGLDIKDVQMPGTNTGKYRLRFTKETLRWDYLVSPNQYSTNIFRRAFKYEKEFLEFGYPRNDILYANNNEKYIDKLKRKLKLSIDKKVILYAPTWRDDDFFEKGSYKFDVKLDLEWMRQEISDEYIIVLRMHYLIANKLNINQYEGFVFDFSTYDDIAELYLISDILITDYSSVFFDFANLKRPILYYTYDLEKYRDTLRGFYIDIENDVPGPLLFNTKEVITAIREIDVIADVYSNKYEEFYNRFCEWDDGLASQNIVDKVFKNRNHM